MTRTRGLTLGKYAPFHQGHEFVIETARRETDEVIVVIYQCPETTDIPLGIRAEWIRHAYPDVTVLEAPDGPTIVGDTPEIRALHEDYLLNKLALKGITHFYSSEFYGDHVSKALGAVNRQVDAARAQVPATGTAIRQNPFAHRHYLRPNVYREFVINVVFLGAPCSGKTTLAERLAREFGTQWMPEYGREYWERHQVGRRLSPLQLVEIAEGHWEREEALLYQSDKYLFTDTNALTTLMFAFDYHGDAEPRLRELADRATGWYDVVFLCDIDFPYVETWDRSGDVHRQSFQQRTVNELEDRKITYTLLRGSVDERVEKVRQTLSTYRKHKPRS